MSPCAAPGGPPFCAGEETGLGFKKQPQSPLGGDITRAYLPQTHLTTDKTWRRRSWSERLGEPATGATCHPKSPARPRLTRVTPVSPPCHSRVTHRYTAPRVTPMLPPCHPCVTHRYTAPCATLVSFADVLVHVFVEQAPEWLWEKPASGKRGGDPTQARSSQALPGRVVEGLGGR